MFPAEKATAVVQPPSVELLRLRVVTLLAQNVGQSSYPRFGIDRIPPLFPTKNGYSNLRMTARLFIISEGTVRRAERDPQPRLAPARQSSGAP